MSERNVVLLKAFVPCLTLHKLCKPVYISWSEMLFAVGSLEIFTDHVQFWSRPKWKTFNHYIKLLYASEQYVGALQ
jgi:hypothetical protein